MTVPLPIETERLVVRPFAPDADAGAMVAVYCDPEVMRYIPGGALAGFDQVREGLRLYERAQAKRGFSSWAITERGTGQPIGDVGFGVFQPTGDIELGYTLARSAWGRGLATEAARACLIAGMKHLDAERIIAVVDRENHRSQRVAERIGMARLAEIEAHERPHVMFGVVRGHFADS